MKWILSNRRYNSLSELRERVKQKSLSPVGIGLPDINEKESSINDVWNRSSLKRPVSPSMEKEGNDCRKLRRTADGVQ